MNQYKPEDFEREIQEVCHKHRIMAFAGCFIQLQGGMIDPELKTSCVGKTGGFVLEAFSKISGVKNEDACNQLVKDIQTQLFMPWVEKMKIEIQYPASN